MTLPLSMENKNPFYFTVAIFYSHSQLIPNLMTVNKYNGRIGSVSFLSTSQNFCVQIQTFPWPLQSLQAYKRLLYNIKALFYNFHC